MITVEQLPVDGAPQVGVTVTSTSAVISVEMSWDGREWHPIASSPRSQRVSVAGADFFRHYTPPLNVEVTYRVVVHSGTVASPLEASITIPSDVAWLQDPLNPRSAVSVYSQGRHGDGRLSLVSTSLQAVSRPQAMDAAMINGDGVPVAAFGARQAPTGVPFALYAFAAGQGELVKSVQALFRDAGAVVARGLPAEAGLDPVVHVGAPDLRESPTVGNRYMQWRRWEMSLTQVRGPGLRVVIPFFTYSQVIAAWRASLGEDVTYAEAIAARPTATYVDWSKDPEP